MMYEELYKELYKMDDGLLDDIELLEESIERHKTKQLLAEQELAGLLLLRTEISQFLKDSAMTDI